MRSPRALLLAVTVSALLVFPVFTKAKKGRGSKWWALAKAGEPSNLVDNSIRGNPFKNYLDPSLYTMLNKKQQRLVRENPGSLVALAKGAQLSISECQHQFSQRRWNCHTSERGRSVFGKITDQGCRESAFVYAITAAGIAHAISRACSEGLIESCTCDYRQRGPSGAGWEWGGCSDNVHYGRSFAKEFADAPERGRNFRNVMNLHNNEAGRLHVASEMRRECKCHGMSGSCTVKTCWMRLPPFRVVGDRLKDRFDGASRVLVSNAGNNRPLKHGRLPKLKPSNPQLKSPVPNDLIYYEDSPNFCTRNVKLGTQGTVGRLCNATSIGMDGCDLMCCSRGYRTEEYEVLERCNCTFHWCCQVKCKTCKALQTVHTCL
uniref:Protein Wnt n=1 Tax=Strigamia maritima TaxID=126957 RepID=T1IPG8_STRMM